MEFVAISSSRLSPLITNIGAFAKSSSASWVVADDELLREALQLLRIAAQRLDDVRHAEPPLTHVPGVAQRIAAGLRPHRKAMRFLADTDLLDCSRRRIEHVDDVVVPAGQPEPLTVDADVAHVGTSTAGNGPRRRHAPGGEVDDGVAAWTTRLAAHARGAAVRHVELGPVAARVEPVRADARLDEPGLFECGAVDEIDTARAKFCNIEDLPVRADSNILRDAAARELEISEHLPAAPVDLHESLGVLTRHDQIPAVDREIAVVDAGTLRHGEGRLQRHRVRIAKVKTLERLRDDDRRAAIGREVHVVGIVHGHGLARLAGHRVDRRSEEHTSELQSLAYLVCRLLLEKKKK